MEVEQAAPAAEMWVAVMVEAMATVLREVELVDLELMAGRTAVQVKMVAVAVVGMREAEGTAAGRAVQGEESEVVLVGDKEAMEARAEE